MKIKKLEKATEALASIKRLDAEIIEIEKYAMKVANGELACSFTLNLLDKTDKKPVGLSVEEIDMADSRDYMRHMHEMMFPGFMRPPGSEEKKADQLKNELTERATLQILGVLLHEKQSIRSGLLRDLRKFGVEIE